MVALMIRVRHVQPEAGISWGAFARRFDCMTQKGRSGFSELQPGWGSVATMRKALASLLYRSDR